MFVINQPMGGRGRRMGDVICALLQESSPGFAVFRACTAFVRASGVLQLASALEAFAGRGGRIQIAVGVDEGITSRQGLELLMKFTPEAFVFHNPVSIFHPKVYLFEQPMIRAVAFVGSSNLTSGGLFTNYEANLGAEFDLGVGSDRDAYQAIVTVFLAAIDVESGNAKRLNAEVLRQLVEAGVVADERRRERPRASARGGGRAMLFPRTPVPPPPRLPASLQRLVPSAGTRAKRSAINPEFRPAEAFVMVLGVRDTRQGRGYSRDVFVPLVARDQNPNFWGWPKGFSLSRSRTVGKYQERRIDMLVRPVAGQQHFVEGVRLYHYDIKHEFRLNCGRLVEGARPSDLLVIQRSLGAAPFSGRRYEYEAAVLNARQATYAAYAAECRHQVPGSAKRWGYI